MSVLPNSPSIPAVQPSTAAALLARASRYTHAFRGDSLKALALRGSLWTFGAYGASQVLRLASSLILTRLLEPGAFGLMALVNVIMSGLQMFSDVGIGPAIIQSKREDATFLNTAWTLQIVRGFCLTALACILAWPVARFYDQSQLLGLLPVVGLTALIASFQTTAQFTVNRKMDVKRIMLLQLLGQVVAFVTIVAWAKVHPSVWALAGSGVISGLIMLFVGFWWLPSNHTHRLCWDESTRRELMAFGRWIFLSTVLTFLAGQADRLLMGKLVDPATLGVYSVALMLAALPTQLILKVSGSVVFPAYARLARTPLKPRPVLTDSTLEATSSTIPYEPQRSPEDALPVDQSQLPSRLQRVRLPLLLLGCSLAAGLMAGAPWLVPGLYRSPFHAAAWMLQVLAVAAVFQFLEQTLGSALLAIGRSKDIAAGNFFKLACLVALVPLGYHYRGILGVLFAIAIGDALKYLMVAYLARKQGLRTLRADAVLLGLTAIAATLAWLAAHTLQGPNLLRASLAMLVACMAVGVAALVHRRMNRV